MLLTQTENRQAAVGATTRDTTAYGRGGQAGESKATTVCFVFFSLLFNGK